MKINRKSLLLFLFMILLFVGLFCYVKNIQPNYFEIKNPPVHTSVSVPTTGLAVYQKDISSLECEDDFVKKVYDGDTVLGKKLGKIRILGIDTPEIYHPDWPLKSYKFYGCGEEAKKLADKYLYHKNVKVCFDKNEDKRGGYNRVLGYVFFKYGSGYVDYGALAIAKGYAKVYNGANFTFKKWYKELEKKSKKLKLGVWGEYCKKQDLEFKKKHNLLENK